MSRPRKNIDQKQFENLCGLQCTKIEICDWFGITDKTLDRWCRDVYRAHFSEVFRQKRGNGKIALRRAQFQAAQSGNASLLIWLGRNWLGQSENESIDTEINVKEDGLSQSLREMAEGLESDDQ